NAHMRLRYLIAEPDPVIVGYDQDGWALAFDYHAHPLDLALATVEAVRANTLPLLKRMTVQDWQKTGRHTESGRYATEDWLAIYVEHLEKHSRQLERNLAHARGVDAAGLHDRRAGAGDSGVHRRRTHRLVRIHVRRQLRAYRAHPPRRSDGAPPRLMDGRMTPREQTVLLAAASLYAVVAIVTGIRGGGDLEIHFPEAALWLARQ